MDFENPLHLRAGTRQVRDKWLEQAKNVSITIQQNASTRDIPVKGPVWVSKFAIARPVEDNSRDLLLGVVDETNDTSIRYDRPTSEALRFQWVGYRSGVEQKDAPEPPLSEAEKFARLDQETRSPLAILYIYGGNFALHTPAAYRKTAGSLSQTTGGKVLMVHQRLAPQNPFPSALLDVFQAYLTLISPPQGSPHAAIPPSSIVVAGDSSGACLSLGLLQVLLRLGRRNASIKFHGRLVRPSVPAGVALLSPVADNTNSLPSYQRNSASDIFPFPVGNAISEKVPYLEKSFPTCQIWPTKPARANIYCEGEMLAHPLVSPAACPDWSGSCPLWFGSGQEQIVDASRLLAQTAHKQGVSVTLQEYEAMPHIFFWYFVRAPQTRRILAEWAAAIDSFGKGSKPPSKAVFVRAKGLKYDAMDHENLVPFTVEEAREIMRRKASAYRVPTYHQRIKSSL